MQTTLPRLLPETRQIFCTEHKVSKVHEISAEAENHHVFAFHFVSPALVSLRLSEGGPCQNIDPERPPLCVHTI